MTDRQLIADLLSALEYHTEQTRPIEFSRVAIEAAREYLRKPAQPQQEPVATYHGSNDFGHEVVELEKAIPIGAKLYTSPPAQQQEPVAVVSGYYGGQCVILPIDPARIFNSNTALYTSPPAQRKPLTVEEIGKVLHDAKVTELPNGYGPVELEIVRAIEAAHGIKGGA